MDLGKPCLFVFVDRPAQHRPEQKPAQMGKEGEEVRGGKARAGEPQGEEPGGRHVERGKPIPQRHHRNADGQKRPGGKPPKERPEEHTKPQKVQYAKLYHNASAVKPQPNHAIGDQRHGHGAAEDDGAPPDAPASQRDAGAGQHDKHHAAILLYKLKDRVFIPQGNPQEILKVKEQVDDDDRQNGHAAKGVQLPDPMLGRCHHPSPWARASSSSSRTR